MAQPPQTGPSPSQAPAVEKAVFGTIAGGPVDLFTLRNRRGLVVKVCNFGATVTELHVPDRQGRLGDVVLGFDTLDGYVQDGAFIGSIVGRVANRIRQSRFTLEGKTYELLANDPPHHLHGGRGWNKVLWHAEASQTSRGPAVEMRYRSADGEDNYPGNVEASVTFTLTDDDELLMSMRATTDQPTLVNLAHHGYFNLAAEAAPTIHGHRLELHAARYTPGDPVVPDGRVAEVRGTPFDFTVEKGLGEGLAQLQASGAPPTTGFDQNFIVDGEPTALREVARVTDPGSGRVMTVAANQPGVQLYTGQFLPGVRGKSANGGNGGNAGRLHVPFAGFCLETQTFPNAINVPAWREQAIVRPGKPYQHEMSLAFRTA